MASNWNWFADQLGIARSTTGIGRKRKFGASSASDPYQKKNIAIYQAARNEHAKEGLFLEFSEENVKIILELFEAVRRGEDSQDIAGHWERFSLEAARQFATRHVTWLLEKFCEEENGQSVEDVLGGIRVDVLYEVGYDRLTLMARESAESFVAESTNGLGDDLSENHIGNQIFSSAANIKVFYNDIIYALINRISGVIERLDGSLCFPTMVGKTRGAADDADEAIIKVQVCHGGGLIRHGRDIREYERDWSVHPFYIIDQFGHGAVYDLNTLSDTKTGEAPELRKISLGESGRFVSRLGSSRTEEEDGNLYYFKVKLWVGKTYDGSEETKSVPRPVHRLLQMNAFTWGLGMANNAALKDYLDGMTIEEAFPYTARDERQYERRLIEKGWTNVKFADWCDTDHLIGRSKDWMNCAIFTMPCSHRWNSCASHVRITAGHWCFAFGYKTYNGGN